MVGHIPLEDIILVRVQVSQLWPEISNKKNNNMGTFRTKAMEQKYKEFREAGMLNKDGCNLCAAPSLKEFKYWRITENSFPYDGVAEVNHMLVLTRHATEAALTPEEKAEFDELKMADIGQDYEFIIESTHKRKSIPGHMHYHLIVAKVFPY
jgi:hypothetical protein